jgi:restriction system protein
LPFIRETKIGWNSTFSWVTSVISWFKEWGLLIVTGIIICLVLMKVIPYYRKIQRVKRSDIRTVDQLTGDQFEDFLVVFFRLLGYSAKKTKRSRDHGADVILDVNGVRVVVQAKRERNKISNSAIQEVVASKAIYNATEAWVVTNSYYTEPAKELARANNVQLWDRDRLIAELSKINMKKHNNNTGA